MISIIIIRSSNINIISSNNNINIGIRALPCSIELDPHVCSVIFSPIFFSRRFETLSSREY